MRYKDDLNIHRLLWANDYPHPDSTWPISRQLLREQMAHLSRAEQDLILHDNSALLYGLTV